MSVLSLHLGLNYVGTAYELAGCANDARDLAALCKPIVASQTTLLNNKADRDGAHKAVKKLCQRLGPLDAGIVTLSSHGTRERQGARYMEAIVWADGSLTYDHEFDELFADRAPGSLLLIVADCCHSGGLPRATHSKARTISVGLCQTHKTTPPIERDRRGVLAWQACGEREYAYDASFDGRANGAFTYYVIEAHKKLKAGATFADWFKLVAGKRPKGFLPSQEYPQTPEQYGSHAMQKRRVPL